MADREKKLLAYGVGGLIGLLLLFSIFRMVKGGIDAKKRTLSDRVVTLSKATQKNKLAKMDRTMVGEYQRKTLSSDNMEFAHLEFQHWLETQVEEAGLDKTRFNFQGMPRTKKTIKELSYLVTGTGDVKQIIAFLHGVQSGETLHRVRMLDLQKKKEGIQMSARIDAICMPPIKGANGKPVAKIPVGSVNPYRLPKTLEEYNEPIAMRNIFSPANEAPKFESLKQLTVELGSRLSERLEATDPEKHDLVFELDDSAPEWLDISKNGKLTGRPKEEGRFKFKVYCMDQGIPSKETVGELTVKVVPAKEPEPEREAPPEFDSSKLAFVTAIRKGGRDPRPHLCLHLRDKDEIQRLMEGDELKVGEWNGQVTEVDPDSNTAVLQMEDEEYELRLGYPLSEARRIERVPAKEQEDKEEMKLRDV